MPKGKPTAPPAGGAMPEPPPHRYGGNRRIKAKLKDFPRRQAFTAKM